MASHRTHPVVLAVLALSAAAAQAGSSGATLAVSATVLSKNICKFSTHALLLNFGTIDASSTLPQTAQQALEFVCNGSAPVATYAVSADDGLSPWAPGARRMLHVTAGGEFLPYALSLSATTGSVPKGVTQTISISGTVAPSDFQQARPGRYADLVVITVAP